MFPIWFVSINPQVAHNTKAQAKWRMYAPMNCAIINLVVACYKPLTETMFSGRQLTASIAACDDNFVTRRHFRFSEGNKLQRRVNQSILVKIVFNTLTSRYVYVYICVTKLTHHSFRQWFFACSAPNHYLEQCRIIVDWTIRNKFHSHLNQNTMISIRKDVFE